MLKFCRICHHIPDLNAQIIDLLCSLCPQIHIDFGGGVALIGCLDDTVNLLTILCRNTYLLHKLCQRLYTAHTHQHDLPHIGYTAHDEANLIDMSAQHDLRPPVPLFEDNTAKMIRGNFIGILLQLRNQNIPYLLLIGCDAVRI